MFSTLGDVSETEQITIKPYPACQLSHASLDALAEIELGGREISRATFFVPADAAKIVCDPIDRKRAPLTEYDAKFSLPWCAALLILDGGITAESFDDINRPDVRALTERIEYRIVDSPTVAASAPGRVEIEFVDGTTATGRVPFSAGGPDRPLSDEAFMRKFTTNVGSAERANLIIEAIDELLDIDSVDEFAETIA